MPDPDLDEVDRKIKEAKELAREVRQPETERDETAPPEPAHKDDEEGFTRPDLPRLGESGGTVPARPRSRVSCWPGVRPAIAL